MASLLSSSPLFHFSWYFPLLPNTSDLLSNIFSRFLQSAVSTVSGVSTEILRSQAVFLDLESRVFPGDRAEFGEIGSFSILPLNGLLDLDAPGLHCSLGSLDLPGGAADDDLALSLGLPSNLVIVDLCLHYMNPASLYKLTL